MQFYTSLTSLLVQIPAMFFLLGSPLTFMSSSNMSAEYLWCCVLNGIFFHFQTMSAYVLMDFISPVTHR
jgi:solute carrier family 35 protein E2